MVVEESVRYSLTAPESTEEWFSDFADRTGSLRLGPENRNFFVSLYHEFHCLQQFHATLLSSKAPQNWGHIQHCLNYLREWSLCQADVTLEPGDFTTRNFTEDRVGSTHICRDWSPIMETVAKNWDDWVIVWREIHRSSTKSGESSSSDTPHSLGLITYYLDSNLQVNVEGLLE